MKRFIALILLISSLALLVACGDNKGSDDNGGENGGNSGIETPMIPLDPDLFD